MADGLTGLYLARRNPRLERGEFARRWRRHGALALSFSFMDPCVGYFHNDVLADPPGDSDPYTGELWSDAYDGVGVVMFTDNDDLETQFHDPEFPILLADEFGAFNEPVANFAAMVRHTAHREQLGSASKFFAFLRAGEGISPQAFAERWLAHVAHVMSSPALESRVVRYVHWSPMSPADSAEDPLLRERLDIGLTDVAGIAEVGFASRSDLEAYLAHPDREAVRDDLAQFADLRRSVMVLTNEVTMKATTALR